MPQLSCDTPLLHVAYLDEGPRDGQPLLLLHGWPDDARTWREVIPVLNRAGYRTLAPWLRGFGGTRFRSRTTMRSGEMVAMAQDALDLTSAVGVERFAVAGHDWGARIAYILAALCPGRVTHCAALSVSWTPGELPTPSFEQAMTAYLSELARVNGFVSHDHRLDFVGTCAPCREGAAVGVRQGHPGNAAGVAGEVGQVSATGAFSAGGRG